MVRQPLRGLTLIELMVTVVILVLLLLGVAPSIGAWMRNTQVRNVASSMLAGLNRARNEAMRRNVPVRFSLVSLADSTVLDSSCALSAAGVSWVVSVRNPAGFCQMAPVITTDTAAYDAALADPNNPLIVEAAAGGVGGKNVVVAAELADGSAAADTVTFGSFGRITDAAPIGFINISNATAGGDYRRLRIELGTGGTVRLCDLGVTVQTDPRYCPTGAIP
jgi:type IV fimbrial biogenesis protein FimT